MFETQLETSAARAAIFAFFFTCSNYILVVHPLAVSGKCRLFAAIFKLFTFNSQLISEATLRVFFPNLTQLAQWHGKY